MVNSKSSAITDEGSQRLPKCLEIVNLLAIVNEPQSSNYTAFGVKWGIIRVKLRKLERQKICQVRIYFNDEIKMIDF